MPKRTKTRRRGKAKPRYIVPSHKYKGKSFIPVSDKTVSCQVVDIINDPARNAPSAIISHEGGYSLVISPEGLRVGDTISIGKESGVKIGNVLPLGAMPEGTVIFNIEVRPNDGGKLVRSSGMSARVVSKDDRGVGVKLPSRQIKVFHPNCRATVGIAAGGGRQEKPLLKAGKKKHSLRAKAVIWPVVAARAMNAADHPMGGGKRRNKRPKTVSRRKPSGAKTGSIAARRTGRKRGRK